jgi:hypothetical protein
MTINIYNHLVKSPEGCFKRDIIDGYGLSRVEADVLWNYVNDFVKEHYLACRFDNQIIFYAVSVEEPAGKPIKDCRLIPVNLTLYSHTDQKIKAKLGISALRESLATRLSEEAHHQGGLLSQADLAEILIVDKSTVKRIVKRIKTKGGSIPTRGEIKDIGPGISHKASLSSITRYFENFIKVVYLHDEGFSLVKIRHLTGTSEKVVGEYLKIYTRCKGSEDYTERLEEIKGYLSSKKRGLL